jgi:hypothetical protein
MSDRHDISPQTKETIIDVIAESIRRKSQAGQLASENEIYQELLKQDILKGDSEESQHLFKEILEETLNRYKDLEKLPDKGEGPRFYSSQFMTESYTRILLQKETNLLLLIAEVVRESSAVYPRPVSLDLFGDSPFNLTQGELQGYLQQMAREEGYRDIMQTTTSAGNVFLYSSLHLEPDHASMLAEWFDVGQFNNP